MLYTGQALSRAPVVRFVLLLKTCSVLAATLVSAARIFGALASMCYGCVCVEFVRVSWFARACVAARAGTCVCVCVQSCLCVLCVCVCLYVCCVHTTRICKCAHAVCGV